MKQIPPLPRDIKRHILKKIILYARKPLFWAAVMVAVNLSIRDRLAGVPVIRILLFIGTILLPFLVIGIPKHFLNKSIVGTVRTVHIQEETGTYCTGTRHWPYTKHVIYLDVEIADGKHHRVKAREYGRSSHKGFSVPFEGDIQRHLNDYAEGDTVYRFRGLSYPYVVSQNRKNTVDCIVCGSENPREEGQCHCCRRTLLKLEEQL